MANTSATGGYLAPVGAPACDTDLEDILQAMVVGITGMPGRMVRPRWQPGNPKQPEPTTDWCAIGVTETVQDANPAITHDPNGQGVDVYVRHQELRVLATFYGPAAQGYAQRLADGITIPQNGEALRAQGFSFIEALPPIAVPELVNQQWVRRYDMTLRLRRKTERTYPVLNILSADPVFSSD
ncbi:phage neck terminator protein [Metapseudomonas otitidis]|uniref:Phage neck terminator protein gp12-like domain-containing protein n=2 Tax=Metapseudomonas otitidis TaxID=319939 RepID=A0A7X3KSY6_9GAMM|nr:hypothetical protein [Pseudomonas otitidis]MBO2926654.1 hypothetical protein [Pseudomonas otitidis]MDG9784642.1 hypothetical protein [Pseudomonas otitidis]MWK54682.1 hypothetical protein [Pseudomonas otitidis]